MAPTDSEKESSERKKDKKDKKDKKEGKDKDRKKDSGVESEAPLKESKKRKHDDVCTLEPFFKLN
jgi:hypothetical protein